MKPRKEFEARKFLRGTLISLAISFFISLGLNRFTGTPVWVGTLAFGLAMPGGAMLIDYLMPYLRTRSFLLTVLLQVVAMALIMGTAFFLALHLSISAASGKSVFDAELLSQYKTIANRKVAGFMSPMQGLVFAVAMSFVITAILQVSSKLGRGVLWNWLTGKYHEPHEETRIFMFLDLKDSTTLAERLGNLKFSALVRDFFQALSKPAQRTSAEVSHYIGDEAVISWRPKHGLREANCIRFLDLFRKEIESYRAYFEKEYGHVPRFKAGVHIGSVVATEVGEEKSEIVFHGDVMNSTARIQGLCNELGQELLISEELREALGASLERWSVVPLGERSLKGRVAPVTVFGIEPGPAMP